MNCPFNLISDDTSPETVCSCQATASAVEEKLALSQSELQQVKASIKQYESLLDSYKIQVREVKIQSMNTVIVHEESDPSLLFFNRCSAGWKNAGRGR